MVPFLVKTKVKLGQMNWWAHLTNIIDYRFFIKFSKQSKSSPPVQWKFPFPTAATLFSSCDFSRSETSSIVKKCGAKIRGRAVASKCLICLVFFRKIAWPWIISIKIKLVPDITSNLFNYHFHNCGINPCLKSFFKIMKQEWRLKIKNC